MTSQLLTGQAYSEPRSLLTKVLHVTLQTAPHTGQLALRLGLAAVFFPHGAQKALGLFGGYGWNGTYAFFTQQMGLPGLIAAIIILLEFLGPFFLLAGFAVRPIALGFLAIMLGSIITVHGQFGFFMNWSGNQAGEGIEYALLAMAISTALIISGAGSWSLDRKLISQ